MKQPALEGRFTAEDHGVDGSIETKDVILARIGRRFRRAGWRGRVSHQMAFHGSLTRGGKASVNSPFPNEKLGL